MFGPQKLHKTISTPNLCAVNPNAEIVKSRGFKPSDRKDPQKREFLVNLSKRIWHMVNIKSVVTGGRVEEEPPRGCKSEQAKPPVVVHKEQPAT